MAQLISDKRDMEFVLHEQLNIGKICENDLFEEYHSKKTVDLILSEARNLAVKEILPLQKVSDEGCTFENGTVRVPEPFRAAYKKFHEGEWLAMSDSPEWGGQNMPKMLSNAANEYFFGACNSFMLYNILTHGAARLVDEFGTEAQKALCLKKMLTGKWSGTMLLTEPEAGSDVGALTTSAKQNPDGTYTITGNKIFISAGEHDMVENIIHPTLARIEGAPEGTRGISLFLVPKYRINEDGSLGAFNDVVCTGIEHKMGLHGNATCSLTLGGKGECIGTLLGEENKGMAAMFRMMNEARQMVGLQGLANASASYMYALDYARQRVQTKHLTAPPGSPSVTIINHPDVRRQLMLMKSYVEGLRSLIYFNGMIQDMQRTETLSDEKVRLADLEEFLTPIIKGYGTDKACEVCNHGVHVYGGYGFIEEYPVAQLLRDVKIFQIYEGTNGIQSMDLMGRKLSMNKGNAYDAFVDEIRKRIVEADEIPETEALSKKLTEVLEQYKTTVDFLGKVVTEDPLRAFGFSHPLLEVTGDLTMAWMHLWRASMAVKNKGKKKKDANFYDGLMQTASFFINTQLPITSGKMAAIMVCDKSAVDMVEAAFGGK